VPSVAVVGAGIGGLTTAIALRRAGIDVRVYERAPSLASVQRGGGLVLWHNAVLALRCLGLEDALAAAGHEMRRHEFRTARGRRLADWPMERITAREGVAAYAVSRPALHRLLADAAGDVIRFGARCDGFTDGPDGVVLRVGEEDVAADVLVGADGLRSLVRRELRPYEPPPRFAGYTAWQGVTRFAGPSVPPGTFVNLWGRGRRFLYFRLDDDDLVYWDGVTSDRIGHELDSLGRTRGELVAEQFGDWAGPISDLVAATAEHDITPIDIYDRLPIRSWSTDRVTLVGDAAHPMTFNLGQGAGQAIEDGVVLADCLGAAAPAEALHTYERRRRDRTAEMVQTSWTIGAVGRWSNRAAVAFRDAFMRATFDRVIFRQSNDLMMKVDFR
jgi:2-polyprenyl-6-methoxyphenol hydroxylase-like FAD-dependent oxidoreductase